MKLIAAFFASCSLILMLPASLFSQSVPDNWLTPCEKSGFMTTPRYAETMQYCRRLAKASTWIKVTSFGKSAEGRDLPLVIASKGNEFDAKKASKTKKAIILIQNGIHAGEIEGKDACLMLLRDIAITKTKSSLLDHAILLIIPIYNVDGHERFGPYNRINQNGPREMGWRVTAQNLNLNRDYMKADAPETQAWLKMFNAWLPDFFIDCHVTDGADYQYIVTYGIETQGSVSPPVRAWIRDKYLPFLSTVMTDGVPLGPLIYFRDDLDPLKGLTGSDGTGPPRFSTVYATLQNRPGLLIEMHMLKNYKSRVRGNYTMLDSTIHLVNREYKSLRQAVFMADSLAVWRRLLQNFPLEFQQDTVANGTLHFYGNRQTNEQSEVSGATRRVYSIEHIEEEIPVFDHVKPTTTINPPIAYLIPQQWQQVIERLKMHGLHLRRLKNQASLQVEEYRFSDPKWAQTPFEGRHRVSYSVEKVAGRKIFPAGTIVVPLDQRAAKVAIHALEPEAPDAFVSWGFFDAIFEQKEYAEDYVMETLARDMMSKNPDLKAEFDAKVRSDTAFARSPGARLNFFYQHSPYWDSQVKLYPVARLVSNMGLNTEPVK
jgi:hypothetical protein